MCILHSPLGRSYLKSCYIFKYNINVSSRFPSSKVTVEINYLAVYMP